MDKSWMIFAGFLCILFFVALFVFTELDMKEENQRSERCIGQMVQAIPDPNDTESRSEFLKDCYEK